MTQQALRELVAKWRAVPVINSRTGEPEGPSQAHWECADELESLLGEQREAQGTDMVLVPRVPTLEMQHAYMRTVDKNRHRMDDHRDSYGWHDAHRDGYIAMLAAAPVASQMGEPVALPKVIEEVCFTLRAHTAYQRIGDYKLADKLEAAFSGREGPLVEYFRGEGYQEYGWYGDEHGRSAEENAVYFLRERSKLNPVTAAPAAGMDADVLAEELWKEFWRTSDCSYSISEQEIAAIIRKHLVSPREGWVKCSERLPEVGDEVIVFINKSIYKGPHVTCLARLLHHEDGDAYYWNTMSGGSHTLSSVVTHWQPLPAPPASPPREGD